MKCIEVIEVSKNYNHKVIALDNITFSIEKGEIIGLLGKNGAGKTTLLSLLSNEIMSTSGKILVNGNHLNESNNSKICIVQQELGLFDFLSVKDHLKYFSKIRSNDSTFITNKRVEEVISDLKLENFLSKLTIHLSGGEKRRVMIALGLISDPEILILDEPTANLDIEWRMYIIDYLLHLNETKNKTIIYSSHILEEVEKISDKILLLNSGRKTFFGTIDIFKQSFKYNQKVTITKNKELTNFESNAKNLISNSNFLILENHNNIIIYFDTRNYIKINDYLSLVKSTYIIESLHFEDFIIINGKSY